MFSQVLVCPQRQFLSKHASQVTGDLCPMESLSSGRVSVQGESLSRGISVRGSLSRGSVSRVGSLSRGISVQWEGLCPGGVSVQGESLSRASLSKGSLSRVGSLSGGSLSRRVSVQGVSVSESLSRGSLSRGSLYPGGSLSGRPPCNNERVVCILLECILVVSGFNFLKLTGPHWYLRVSISWSAPPDWVVPLGNVLDVLISVVFCSFLHQISA